MNPVFSLEDPLLTVEDVAAALGLNQQTIRNYIDDGVLPAVRVGNRRVRIRRSALDAFVAAGETPDLVRGLAALNEARQRLARALKSTEGLSNEVRSGESSIHGTGAGRPFLRRQWLSGTRPNHRRRGRLAIGESQDRDRRRGSVLRP